MRKVLIVGLAKSGIAAAEALASRGDSVFITEIKESEDVKKIAESLVEKGIVKSQNIELGRHSERFIKEVDLIVVSPGVPSDSSMIKLAMEYKRPVISELELGYSMCPAPVIAVTGTSGKTTVTTLIGRILSSAGKHAVVCGNMGNPLTGELKKIKRDSIVVLEVSSFQLEWIKSFRPKTSIILNISENHLDRHKDMEEYIYFKSRIFLNQKKEDVLLLNGKDRILKGLSKNVKGPSVIFFDEYKDFGARLNIKNEDFLAAMSAASLEGVDEAIMLDVISNFKGIEHRLERVGSIDGVEFINDSKATTISSVMWALKSLDGNIILIMGGRYKGGDFGALKSQIEKKVNCIIAIGEARRIIKDSVASFARVIEEESLESAIRTAHTMAKKGNKILLSPACSSFDMFKSYEERGQAFKKIVYTLTTL